MLYRLSILMYFLILSYNTFGQVRNVEMFIFGHSLIDHRPPATSTPSDETTVPHWVYLLAKSSGNDFAAGGQYGFLPQHANLPPISQWGYDIVPGVWESDTEQFSETDINTILITAGNFIQYQGPDLPYEDPNNTENVSPISATESIVDWVEDNTTDAKIYIYENWPDMAGFIEGEGFPANDVEFMEYNSYTNGSFHDWWLEYQDALLESRMESNVRMIPVGPIIADLSEGLLNEMEFLSFYEDNAPHGTPNLYFLAGLITYMAVFEEKAPSGFTIPKLIDPLIHEKYTEMVDYIWSYLNEFNTDSGDSRVFSSTLSHVYSGFTPQSKQVQVYPNPSTDMLYIHNLKNIKKIEIRNNLGQIVQSSTVLSKDIVNIQGLIDGQYLMIVETASGDIYRSKFLKIK